MFTFASRAARAALTITAGLGLTIGASALPSSAGGGGALPVAGASLPVAGTVISLGTGEVIAVSKTGRYVLGLFEGRYAVRDVFRDKIVRRLPTSARYKYIGLSDSGRYVVYTRTKDANPTRCNEPWVRDRKTNKARSAATTRSGAAIAAAWTPSTVGCTQGADWRTQLTFSDPAMSGNGRYVAFCANLQVPDRLDLYVKNLKTKKLRSWPGICAEAEWISGTPRELQPPQISETGRVVLLPGYHLSNREGFPNPDAGSFNVWRPASLLIDRSVIRTDVGGVWPVLSADGSGVYSIGPGTCDGGWVPCPGGPIRYDVASGAISVLAAGDPGPGPMSRRGRYVLVIGGDPRSGDPTAPLTTCDWVWGQPDAPLFRPCWTPFGLQVLDRTTGVITDLRPLINASVAEVGDLPAGTGNPGGSYRVPGRPDRTRLSGSGKVVLVQLWTPEPANPWIWLRWM